MILGFNPSCREPGQPHPLSPANGPLAASTRTLMIYLLRHGETVWNTLGRFQGQRDLPLTKRGIEQADGLGKLLSQEIGGRVSQFKGYVSPAGRAQETARRIAICLCHLDVEPRLREVSVGSWDGMTLDEIGVEFPDALHRSDRFDWFFRSPDGETFDKACTRITSWLSELATPAVSHGLISRLLRGVYLGLSEREMLELPVPQNGFYRLDGGKVEFVENA